MQIISGKSGPGTGKSTKAVDKSIPNTIQGTVKKQCVSFKDKREDGSAKKKKKAKRVDILKPGPHPLIYLFILYNIHTHIHIHC